jgi:PAS domain S-box-containing protein
MFVCAWAAISLIRLSGERYPIDATRLPVPWVPMGIAVGVLYFRGADRWPGVFAGAAFAALSLGDIPPLAALIQAVSATLFTLAVLALLSAWRVNAALERWQDPLLLWLAAAIGAGAMACVAGTAVLWAAGLQADRAGHGVARALLDTHHHPIFGWPLLSFVVCWFANWTSGIALVVPAMRLLQRAARRPLARRLRELSLIAAVIVGWSIVAFLPLPWVASLPLCMMALVLVTWSAMRFGASVASIVPLVLALIASSAFISGHGPLHARPEDSVAAIWAFILVISVVGMLIASLLAERDTAHQRQAVSEARYRVLFEASPRPQWVYDPATLRVLMVNEAALRLYGYSRSEFSKLSVAALEAGTAPETVRPQHFATTWDRGERLHTTRDGTIIQVDLHAEAIEFDGRAACLVFSDDLTDRNRLRGALLDAADRAERKLGRELHDGLGQDLVGLSLIARAEAERVKKGELPTPQTFAFIESVALQAAENCRAIARGLSALAESGGDLLVALRRLPNRFRHDGPPIITVNVEVSAPVTLAEGVQDHIFRIAQEALTNAVKHAAAGRIDVTLQVAQASVRLSVRDDGIGIPPDSSSNMGLGLASMRHRASAIGATFYVTTFSGGGSEVLLECAQFAGAAQNWDDRNRPAVSGK